MNTLFPHLPRPDRALGELFTAPRLCSKCYSHLLCSTCFTHLLCSTCLAHLLYTYCFIHYRTKLPTVTQLPCHSSQHLGDQNSLLDHEMLAVIRRRCALLPSEDALQSRCRFAETRNPKPETRNPKSEARNPKPETRNPKPDTLNPKPYTRNDTSWNVYKEHTRSLPKPSTPNPKP
ncbi:hypothetical protein T484DRAFT_2836948 [Baffinella frigidus]|nr:hypothetical protein T484DRAFT_2836948 [Cryptophyta sp. CCMP2293]